MDVSYLRSVGLQVWPSQCAVLSRPARAADAARGQSAEPVASGATVPSQRLREWENLQNSLRSQLIAEDDGHCVMTTLQRIGGLDIGFENGTNKGTAVLVVCEFRGDEGAGLQLVYEDAIDVDMDLPYVSGFLFARELPSYRQLLQRLRKNAPQLEPEIFLIDGCGMFHPRELGSASHFGVEENLRTIGVAKKLLVIDGDFDQWEGNRVEDLELPHFGDNVKLIGAETKRVYGLALRTTAPTGSKKQQVESSKKRVYVSVGHRVSLETAKAVVLKCCDVTGGSYIPEPIRLADLTGRAVERAWKQIHNSAPPNARRLVFDVCNLLDDKQCRTLHGILEDRGPFETLATIPADQLKRKRAVIDELFEPFRQMHSDARVEDVRVALKMEKPWSVALRKQPLASHMSGESMKVTDVTVIA